ncbi:MAG: carboxypeptidase regulatory-like domain-containing protein [Planctomycetes bacterium]|nr:carboxypeptidase regulatory-like domain-containing protein [Planctomycetota bacterium]
MQARKIFRIILGILLIPVACAAGLFLAGAISLSRGGERSKDAPRDSVIPHSKALMVPAIDGNVQIRGRVQFAGEQSKKGATIRLSAGFLQLEKTTDADGAFSFDRLPEGQISIVAFSDEHEPVFLTYPSAPAHDITIKLNPIASIQPATPPKSRATGGVTLALVVPPGYEPSAKFTIYALPAVRDARENTLLPKSAEFDISKQQELTIDGMPGGEYSVFAVPFGRSPDSRRALAQTSITITPGKTESIKLDIRCANLSGKIMNAGRGVSQARVRAVRHSDGKTTDTNPDRRIVETAEVELGQTTTDDDGGFSFENLPLGNLQIEANKSGFGAAKSTVNLEPAGSVVSIELPVK